MVVTGRPLAFAAVELAPSARGANAGRIALTKLRGCKEAILTGIGVVGENSAEFLAQLQPFADVGTIRTVCTVLRAATAALGAALHAYLAVLFYVPSVGALGIGAAFSAALAISDIRSAWRAGRDIVVAGRVFAMMQAAPPAPLPRSFAP